MHPTCTHIPSHARGDHAAGAHPRPDAARQECPEDPQGDTGDGEEHADGTQDPAHPSVACVLHGRARCDIGSGDALEIKNAAATNA